MSRSLIGKAVLAVFLIILVFLAVYVWDVQSLFHPDRIKAILGTAGVFAPILYMALMALAIIISPIPSMPLDIAAGAFFGPWLGTLYSALGALGGAAISFCIARFMGREVIERFLRGHINFCRSCSDRLLAKIVFLSRLIPVVSFDIVSYGAGLTKMSLRSFSVATFLGMLPLTFIYNYFGSVLVVGHGSAVIFGLLAVFFLFVFPAIIERYNVLSLRRFFQHAEGRASRTKKNR